MSNKTREITDTELAQFVNGDFYGCPCGAEESELEDTGNVDVIGEERQVEVRCTECGEEWVICYKVMAIAHSGGPFRSIKEV